MLIAQYKKQRRFSPTLHCDGATHTKKNQTIHLQWCVYIRPVAPIYLLSQSKNPTLIFPAVCYWLWGAQQISPQRAT